MSSDVPDNGTGEQDLSASGLHESQIDRRDLEELRSLITFRQAKAGPAGDPESAWLTPGLSPGQVQELQIEPPSIRQFRLKIAELPKQVPLNRLKSPGFNLRLGNGLDVAVRQPVKRRRLLMGELSRSKEENLYKALYEKYGQDIKQARVLAVFPHIPPEAANEIRISQDLKFVQFNIPPGGNASRARPGFYLIILKDPQDQTRKVLFRL